MKKENINTVNENTKEDSKNMQNPEEMATEKECANNSDEKTETAAEATEETAEVDPLEAAKAEIEELKKQALYRQAEFDNFRKRTMKEKADLVLAGGEKTITAMLPIVDDLERALQDKSGDADAVREGMNLIFNKFVKTLEQLGVKKIETQGVDFNVDYHESIALVPGMGEENKGKVIDCVQTGYTLNDKVIRYAKVAVGQ